MPTAHSSSMNSPHQTPVAPADLGSLPRQQPRDGVARATVLNWTAKAASWLSAEGLPTRDEFYARYDTKLNSYNNNIVLFLATTLPYMVLSVPVAVAFRIFNRIRK